MKAKITYSLIAIFSISIALQANKPKWGATGHRTVGAIAEKYLTKKSKKAINKILKGHSLAFYSTFADEIKSDNKYRKYSPWHYVNFDFDTKYDRSKANKKGDLIQAIETCLAVLKDGKSSKKDKTFYLKMLIHFMGDLHQPLHVGRGEDRGGNDIKVKWFNKPSNLHRVWDSNMIDSYNMSYTELAKNADKLSKAQVQALQKGTLLDWVYESQALAKTVYGSANNGDKLYYRYSYDYLSTVRFQLQKGGLRLAKVLNDIFG
ncbi:MAG: S1/P1 nuclease [Flavobacteriaceae bacterium]|nr:S1/P1 nuclease [Flavobacteriaceae bacterium]